MHWFIFEDALRDERGHYFEYVKTFKHGLEDCGDRVDVFASSEAEPWVLQSLSAKALLPPSIWARMSDAAPRWKKLLRYPWHGWLTFRAWRRIFRKHAPPDTVFVPSVFTHHLFGIVPFLLLFGRSKDCTFLLFFPNTPICYDPDRKRPSLRPDLTARFFPFLLRRLKRLVADGKVVLGVETRAMQRALEALTGLEFRYFPHPVQQTQNRRSHFSGPRPSDGRSIVVGSYGGSRFEKGSDLLQTAVRRYLDGDVDARVRFCLQWTDDFTDQAGRPVTKDPWLESHPQVAFMTDYFDPHGGYERQLAETDLMILPYRDSYRYRLSRVVIEAMIAGIPVAVAGDTTLAEQVSEHGACVIFRQESPQEIVAALKECVRRHTSLREEALGKAKDCADHFSVARFRANLVG